MSKFSFSPCNKSFTRSQGPHYHRYNHHNCLALIHHFIKAGANTVPSLSIVIRLNYSSSTRSFIPMFRVKYYQCNKSIIKLIFHFTCKSILLCWCEFFISSYSHDEWVSYLELKISTMTRHINNLQDEGKEMNMNATHQFECKPTTSSITCKKEMVRSWWG